MKILNFLFNEPKMERFFFGKVLERLEEYGAYFNTEELSTLFDQSKKLATEHRNQKNAYIKEFLSNQYASGEIGYLKYNFYKAVAKLGFKYDYFQDLAYIFGRKMENAIELEEKENTISPIELDVIIDAIKKFDSGKNLENIQSLENLLRETLGSKDNSKQGSPNKFDGTNDGLRV